MILGIHVSRKVEITFVRKKCRIQNFICIYVVKEPTAVTTCTMLCEKTKCNLYIRTHAHELVITKLYGIIPIP